MTISVVIPTIPGREKLLERALASVAAQRQQPNQIIVELDPNRTGAAATRNRALARVTSDYIAWLDDDDEFLPNHLKALSRVIGEFDLVYPTPVMVGGNDPTAIFQNGRWHLPWGVPFTEDSATHIRTRGSFIPMTHLVRTAAVRAAGGFPESRYLGSRLQGEDEQYLIALLDNGARFGHLNIQTWRWHKHASNTAGLGR